MREAQSLKLLIPWIEKACDEELYPGLLEWVDKPKKIFSVSWIHKSSEQWDKSKSRVFEDWAAYKKKLGEKDDRDLKAAFRNAMRSKKSEMRFVEKGKLYRQWQIISDSNRKRSNSSSNNKVTKTKQRRGAKKNNSSCNAKVRNILSAEQSTSYAYTRAQEEIPLSSPLPPCDSLFHVSQSPSSSQKTDIYTPNLDEQSQFFHLQSPISEITPLSPSSSNGNFSVQSPYESLSPQTLPVTFHSSIDNCRVGKTPSPITFDTCTVARTSPTITFNSSRMNRTPPTITFETCRVDRASPVSTFVPCGVDKRAELTTYESYTVDRTPIPLGFDDIRADRASPTLVFDTYRLDSTSPTATFESYKMDQTTPSTTILDSQQQFVDTTYLDLLSPNFLEETQQVVPNNDTWNHALQLEESYFLNEFQSSTKQMETEPFSTTEIGMELAPLLGDITKNFLPGDRDQELMSNDMDCELFKFFLENPIMFR